MLGRTIAIFAIQVGYFPTKNPPCLFYYTRLWREASYAVAMSLVSSMFAIQVGSFPTKNAHASLFYCRYEREAFYRGEEACSFLM
jgi:hypothetical protein